MSNWKAQVGRISLFRAIPAGIELPSAAELYKRIWKIDPDNFQKQPSGGFPFAPSVAQGNHDGFVASCSMHPLRIDWAVVAPPTVGSSSSLLLIEDTRRFHDELARIIQAIRESAEDFSVSRAACFVQFACVAADYREANRLIISILPKQYRFHLADEEDLILQINRPVGRDPTMNFITKWAVERVQLLSLTLDTSTSQPSSRTQVENQFIVPVISFDNNNSPMAKILTKEEQFTVLEKALRGVSEGQRETGLEIEGF